MSLNMMVAGGTLAELPVRRKCDSTNRAFTAKG
jgi:hypothetical protein